MPQQRMPTSNLQELDLLLIWDSMLPIPKEVEELYSNKRCYVMKCPEQDIFDIKNILEQENLYIGSNTRIDINAHSSGSRSKKTHELHVGREPAMVRTRKVFEVLRDS